MRSLVLFLLGAGIARWDARCATLARARTAPALALVLALGLATSDCGNDVASPTPVPIPMIVLDPVALATYEGSGQVVHPDVVAASGMGAFHLWLAVTPYPYGNAAHENPSIYGSNDRRVWVAPDGVTNPVVRPSGGYLSDPDLVAADGVLWLFYRQVNGGKNVIHLLRSMDGQHWSGDRVVASAPNHALVSPSVVHGAPHAPWAMWSVNSGAAGCVAAATSVERRVSPDGLSWSDPKTTDLAQPGQVIWHLDVEWLPRRGEYWAVYNTYPAGRTCVTDALWLGRSADGVHWTAAPAPLLERGVSEALRDVLYRSTLVADEAIGTATFWLSGARHEGGRYEWHAATATVGLDDVLARIAAPRRSGLSPLRRALPPPEPDDMPDATGP